MLAIAHYLFAAAFSGTYAKKDWQEWADKQLLKSSEVEDWIVATSLASDIDNLSKGISDKLIDEKYQNPNLALFSDAVIGYYYLYYLEGKITLHELLDKSGKEADGGEASIECEHFYSLLNEIEKKIKIIDDEDFLKHIQLLYEPFKKLAKFQKQALDEY